MESDERSPKIPKAISSGKVRLGSWEIDCHVLEGERRVITQTEFLQIMDMEGRGKDRGNQVVQFLSAAELKHLGGKELVAAIREPLLFQPVKGGIAYGYDGELVIDYCELLLKAKRQGIIGGAVVDRYCFAAESIVLSVAKVGIVALIDEATGYQSIRDKRALQTILDKYLLTSFAKWAKRFPDEFYVEMFRLKKWAWKGMKVNRPAVVGHYTNDVVYSRLAPGVLAELQKRNPADGHGHRRQKHHQWMTDDIGHPALDRHIHTLLAFMRLAPDWPAFKRMVDRAFPRIGQTYLMDLGEEIGDDPESTS